MTSSTITGFNVDVTNLHKYNRYGVISEVQNSVPLLQFHARESSCNAKLVNDSVKLVKSFKRTYVLFVNLFYLVFEIRYLKLMTL